MITDFHTHAFPDAMADRAITTLQSGTDKATAKLDGRISSLLASMDKAGIGRSVVCSIATKPAQFDKILEWSKSISSERIIPLPSVHPKDPDIQAHIAQIAEAGFRGIKLHPYYQEFEVDSPAMHQVYDSLCRHGLLLVCHTGFDIAFPRDRIADPQRVAKIIRAFPELKFVATHLLAWHDWDEVERHLLGRPVYTDFSMTMEFLGAERTREMILRHPRDYVLFGTDSPWQDQGAELERFRAFGLGPEWEQAILIDNASRLLARQTSGSITPAART
ncbi:MAG: amidohydrolase family protein [bacterium]